MAKVSVLGSGAWGTTLAQVLVDAGQEVLIWGRNDSVVAEINSNHTNNKFLENVKLPSEIKADLSHSGEISISKIQVELVDSKA